MSSNTISTREKRTTAALHPSRERELRGEAAEALEPPAKQPKITAQAKQRAAVAAERAAKKRVAQAAATIEAAEQQLAAKLVPAPAPGVSESALDKLEKAKDDHIKMLVERIDREVTARDEAKDALADKEAERAALDEALRTRLREMDTLQAKYDELAAAMGASAVELERATARLDDEQGAHETTKGALAKANADLEREQAAAIRAAAQALEAQALPPPPPPSGGRGGRGGRSSGGGGSGGGGGPGCGKQIIVPPPRHLELPALADPVFGDPFFSANKIAKNDHWVATVHAFKIKHTKGGPANFEALTLQQKRTRSTDAKRIANMALRLLHLDGCTWSAIPSADGGKTPPNLAKFCADFVDNPAYCDKEGGSNRKLWICKRLWPTLFASINSTTVAAIQQDGCWSTAGKWASAAITLKNIVKEWVDAKHPVLMDLEATARQDKWNKDSGNATAVAGEEEGAAAAAAAAGEVDAEGDGDGDGD